MKPDQIVRFRYLAVLWLAGSVALACVTSACLWLGLSFATTAFVYLIAIVLLSLLDSFISSAIFSSIAIGCLNYFFVEPRFSFQVNFAEDLTALTAFLLTAFVVTGFVRRARRSADMERERARLLDLTQDAILVRDANDVVTYWNRGAERLYGWTRHEAVGKNKHDLLRADFPGSFDEAKATLLRSGRWEGEVVHTRRDGQQVTVESRWSLQLDDSGNPIGTLETNHDITERRRAQELLHQSQAAYLAEAQRLSLTGSFGWNVSTGEVFWSEETFRVFGHDPSIKPSVELVMQRVHPDDVAEVRQVIERAAAHGEAFDFEHRLRLPDGSIKHLRVVAHPLEDRREEELRFVGAVMDITARKQSEAALRYSEHRYHTLFRAMAASFWELDFSGVDEMLRALRKSGVEDFRKYLSENPAYVREMMRATRVIDVNDQTVALFGRGKKEELLGNVEPFWPEDTQVYADGILSGAAGKPHYSVECKLRRIDGSTFDALFTAAYPPESMGKGTLVIGVIDVTERKQAFANLEASERRYRDLFHYMPIGLTQIDASQLIPMFKELRTKGVTDISAYINANPSS